MNGPVRVLQVVLSLDPGGTERLVVEIARRLPPPFESVVCCLDAPGAWAEDLRRRSIPVVALERRAGFRPSLSARLAALVRSRRIDVMHCHQYSPYVYGCLAKLLAPRVRLVFTEHGRLSDAPPSPKRRRVNPLLARVPGARFAVCEDLKTFLVAEGFPADRLGVIYNGIDPGPLPSAEARADARRRLGAESDAFLVGTVARLDPVKDLGVLLEALAALRARGPAAHLAVLGDGPERTALEARARELGVAAAVRFLGARSDVRDLLPGLDLYVNCSRSEGVSLTIVEAMAAALPVVATAVGGTPEVVADGASGLLVPPRDPGALTAAMEALAADPALRAGLGREGRAVAERRFSFERMLEQYLRAYRGESPA